MILDFTIDEALRLSAVKRWGIVEMSRDQSVAEHSYNVALVVMDMFQQVDPLIKDKNIVDEAIRWSLLHDMPELVTGDIPSAAKKAMADSLKEFERINFPEYDRTKGQVRALARTMVKIADRVEAVKYASKYCVDPRKEEIMRWITIKAIRLTDDLPNALIEPIQEIISGFESKREHVQKIPSEESRPYVVRPKP